jgi:hypothetical protein
MKMILLILSMLILYSEVGFSKDKTVVTKKTQKVDFDSETIDGQARHPDGSYLVQKRSADFVPLYRVREQFDENIKESIEYLK